MNSQPTTNPRIVLLCDGTWCGRETSTQTNIYLLAKLFGVNIPNADTEEPCFRQYDPDAPPHKQVCVRYRHGVGLGSSFLDYLFNGVTAQDLAAECIAVYKYIVNHYTSPEHEIWMFGLSRGAYTVRCVAGMINNCGIIRRDGLDDGETDMLCQEIYKIWKSEDEINMPHSRQMRDFRRRMSWPLIGDERQGEERLRPPVRFMGLFDTVGSLGIPQLKGGVGFEWPQFHDDIVSSVVQDVCHLVSLHDRFYIFQPCLARRKGDKNQVGIDQEWIPGVHYDLGRQRFQFFRTGSGPWERLAGLIATVPILGSGKIIEPNTVLSDLALWKMLQRIDRHDVGHLLIPQSVLTSEMANLAGGMADGAGAYTHRAMVGSGDVYDRIIEYGPFGSRIGAIVLFMAGRLGLWELFFDRRDRLIPDDKANVYPLHRPDPSIPLAGSVAQLGDVTEKRYPSKTPGTWALRTGRPTP
ncbi:Uncharacterized alpha/beta hydrolase domain (DUF2235) domain containing protein [Rhypophila sp. PSN 637]